MRRISALAINAPKINVSMLNEIVKWDAHQGADHDVRRVANLCRRAADIGTQNLGDQVCISLNFQLVINQQRLRHHQQHEGV